MTKGFEPNIAPDTRVAVLTGGTVPGAYTPAALADLMARRLDSIAARIDDSARIIAVKGRLGEVPEPRRNGVIYDARLLDPLSPADGVLMELRPSTLQQAGAKPGDTITAYGAVVGSLYKGRLTLRLRADRVELAEPPGDREQRRAEQSMLDVLRQAGGTRRIFPASRMPTVALLRSGASDVREDFLRALGELRHQLPIRDIEVSMASSRDIAMAIQRVREDVLVLIRGGGDDADFAVFEAPAVIEALGACRAYRILGLGHSRHRTLADCVADWAASVPAEAGRFLAKRIHEARHPELLPADSDAQQRRHRGLAPLQVAGTILIVAVLLYALQRLLH